MNSRQYEARLRRRRRAAKRVAALSGGLAAAGLAGGASPAAAVDVVRVADIRAGAAGSYADSLTNVGGTLYFAANDGSHGFELWRSDGTPAGTTLVKDIHPGAPGSYADSLTNVGGTLYFRAEDGTSGFELWRSDGTPAGTTLVKDIRPGAADSVPTRLTNVGGTLYFRANDGTTGNELWKAPDVVAPDTTIDSGPAEGAVVSTDSATFGFSGTEGDTAKLQCSLDGAPFSDCASPQALSGLADGTHTAAFRAVDPAGNADPTPASRTFKVADNRFTLPRKGKLNKRKGTLKLEITLPGPGVLEGEDARGLTRDTKTTTDGGETKVGVKPSRKGFKKLKRKARGKRTGKLNVALEFTFTPTGGEPNTESKTYKLTMK